MCYYNNTCLFYPRSLHAEHGTSLGTVPLTTAAAASRCVWIVTTAHLIVYLYRIVIVIIVIITITIVIIGMDMDGKYGSRLRYG